MRLKSKNSKQVARTLAKHVLKLPATLRRSITWDRGSELAAHKDFNGLLRQYFPKGSDLSAFSQRQPDRVAHELNQSPRVTLGWDNPADTLNRAVASTG